MAKREYIQANKDWLEAKAKEEGVKALPKALYRQNHRRQTVRQQPWRCAFGLPTLRPHRGLDHRHSADAYWRQVGTLYPCRNGLREVLTARHPRWLDAYL